MIKNKLMMIIAMIFIICGMIILFLGGKTHKEEFLDIPNQDEVTFVEIYDDFMNDISKHNTIESDSEISEIYDELLSGSKKKSKDSVNDTITDVNGRLIKVVLNNSENEGTTLFVYQDKNGNYYIEQPYVGIYEISGEEYEAFLKYFTES